MNQDLIHVYLMPGMAASPLIFEYIKLPEDCFKLHYLEWILPEPQENLEAYALRMSKKVQHDAAVLIGVSFGGVLVQEMSKFLNLRKLIIVSSVKSNTELPKRLHMLRKLKAYYVLPTGLAKYVNMFSKFAVGKNKVSKRIKLYEKYLSVNDKVYLNWAMKEMVCWKQNESLKNCIHIHGDNDFVFPVKNIDNCVTVSGGTHIMIINKYKWFNKNLPELILG
jgi:hypothetical protein